MWPRLTAALQSPDVERHGGSDSRGAGETIASQKDTQLGVRVSHARSFLAFANIILPREQQTPCTQGKAQAHTHKRPRPAYVYRACPIGWCAGGAAAAVGATECYAERGACMTTSAATGVEK